MRVTNRLTDLGRGCDLRERAARSSTPFLLRDLASPRRLQNNLNGSIKYSFDILKNQPQIQVRYCSSPQKLEHLPMLSCVYLLCLGAALNVSRSTNLFPQLLTLIVQQSSAYLSRDIRSQFTFEEIRKDSGSEPRKM